MIGRLRRSTFAIVLILALLAIGSIALAQVGGGAGAGPIGGIFDWAASGLERSSAGTGTIGTEANTTAITLGRSTITLTIPANTETTSQAALTLRPYGAAAGNTGELRLRELAAGGTNYLAFKSPDALAGNVTWVLPTADAGVAGAALISDAAGTLSWMAGAAALATEPYIVVSNTAGLSAERALAGTANQIILTDGGANAAMTLTTPQDIGTASVVTFGGMTLNGTLTRAADLTIDLTGAATRTLEILNSTVAQVADLRADGTLRFRNGTAFTATLTGTPTADRTITFQDVAGTVYVSTGTDVAVADGGTGLSSGTSGGILGYTAAGTLASSVLLTANGLVIGGGAGATPTALAAATNGQIPIGSTGVAPVLATLTDPAAGITISEGAGTITFALANDLSGVEGLATSGLAARTGADTWTTRSIAQPAAGITVANGDGVAGNPTLALANDLSALEALAGTGFPAHTGVDTWAERTLTAPAAGFTITNPAGVLGNPTFVLADDLSAVEGLGTAGVAVRTGAATWTTRTIGAGSASIVVTNGDGVAGAPSIDTAQNIQTSASPTFAGLAISAGGDITGFDELAFADAAVGASATGRLRRNATNLEYHDGTASRVIYRVAGTDVLTSDGGTGIDTSGSTGVPTISAGTWSVAAQLSALRGGTALDTSGSTGVPTISAGTWSVAAQLSALRGGTAIDTSASTGIPSINAGTWSVNTVTANAFIYGGASGAPAFTAAATDGQLLIGRTGLAPLAAALTGTANRVTVTNGAGTITLSGPQDLHTAASPTFAGLTVSGLTADSFLYSGTGGLLTTTTAPTNGQLLIGSTGAAPARAALTGTANRVTVTNGAGSITLSGPQDLHTAATPTFGGLTLTQAAASSGSPSIATFTGGAHTTLTASTEARDLYLDFSRTVQFATGALTTQRAFHIDRPTYGFVLASTLTNASTVAIDGAPAAGTNATLTNSAALSIGDGTTGGNATNMTGLTIAQPPIATGYTTATILAALRIAAGGASVSLGDQTATLTNLNSARLEALTYVSTTNTRTVTNPATLYVAGAPVASTNVTFTNPGLAFHVDDGPARFDGRVLKAKGADVSSGSTITFGDGNFFDLTGVTTVDFATTTGWTNGSMVVIQCDGSVTINHNTGAPPAGTAPFLLGAASNFGCTAADTLTVILDDTPAWREVARTAI